MARAGVQTGQVESDSVSSVPSAASLSIFGVSICLSPNSGRAVARSWSVSSTTILGRVGMVEIPLYVSNPFGQPTSQSSPDGLTTNLTIRWRV
jgi:hypothetical protein